MNFRLRKLKDLKIKFVTNTTKESKNQLHKLLNSLGYTIEKHEAKINLTTTPVQYFNNTSKVFADTVWPCQKPEFVQNCKVEITYGPMEIQIKLDFNISFAWVNLIRDSKVDTLV